LKSNSGATWSDLKGADVPEASPRGTYLVIAAALRSEIEEGDGIDTLPSEADLVRSHGVGRNTIRRALKVLEAEGLVESVPGVGWRVARGGDRRSLAERMTDMIAEDSLSVGDTYPSEAKLCERFGASRTAVRRVLAQMEGNGLLATVHGKGRTVRALPTPTARP
jgi:DNA-binding FadR family transcriptional regulator